MLERLTRAVLRHRAFVIAGWLVVAVIGAWAGAALPDRLTALTDVPGSASAKADAVLASRFGENTDGSFTVMLHFRQASDAQITAMEHRVSAAVQSVPTATVVQQRALAGVLYALVGTRLGLMDASVATDRLRAALRAEGLGGALVTGPPALEHDVRPLLADDLRVGTVIAVVAALALLLLVLGWCRALLVPFVVAAAVVAGSLVVVYTMTARFAMVMYIPNVIELIGLGLAIDYALLMVHRFRTEVGVQDDVDDAVVRTSRTAGATVVVSGVTAAAGLSALFLMPVPFVRSLGAAGLVVPAVSVLAALTLQPVLLSWLGADGVRPRGWHGLLAHEGVRGRWERLAAAVVARPRRTLALALAVLLLLASPVAALRLSPASLTAIPTSLEASRAVEFVASRIGPGTVTPHSVVIDTGRDGGAVTPRAEAARVKLSTALSKVPGAFVVVSDTTTLFVDPGKRYQRMIVIGKSGFDDDATRALVTSLRALQPTAYGYSPGTTVAVGGAPARGVDFLARIASNVPWIVLASLLIAYALMARAFRSRLLPAVAVAMNLVSVAAAFGVVVLVFRFGVGAGLLHARATEHIEAWALVFLFAMLFGLSMDYQVFVVARIREAHDAGMATMDAIAHGLERTAGVITAAAVIFVAALGGLVLGHITGLQELGVGLVAGVLIDATIVRTLLLPAVMCLLGDRCWRD